MVIFKKEYTTLFRLLLSIIFMLAAASAFSQNTREESVKRYLNLGKQLIKEGRYDSASTVLKSAFIKNAVLPDELLYYYSFSLYKQGDLDQSKKLLDKFLTLSSKKSELYAEAMELLKSIDTSIDAVSFICNHCNGEGFHVHPCGSCRGTGEQKCDLCAGKGKVLVGGASGMKFGMCTSCMGDGIKTCQVCRGKKQIEESCEVCNGKGKVRDKMEVKK